MPSPIIAVSNVHPAAPTDARGAPANTRRLPAEWEAQAAVLLAWPHAGTDWSDRLDAVWAVYGQLIEVLAEHEPVIVLGPEGQELRDLERRFAKASYPVRGWTVPTDDTWIRDYGPLTLLTEETPLLVDARFNGWGGRYPAAQDDRVTKTLWDRGAFRPVPRHALDWVLEGGAIDSDGTGTVLTTQRCLFNANRAAGEGPTRIHQRMRETLGVRRLIALEQGYLPGDDTDGHVDQLARFCDRHTIAYAVSERPEDEHYESLKALEGELSAVRTEEGHPYRLVPLPVPALSRDPIARPLPTSYANFLIVNGGVIVPQFDDPNDHRAMDTLARVFPDRRIHGIDARVLVQEGGAIHCATLTLPSALHGLVNHSVTG